MPYPSNFPGARDAHEIHPIFTDDDKNFRCRNCLIKWKRKPNHGVCVGVPVYEDWEKVPRKLVSKTAMYRDHKRKLPENTLPIAAIRHETNSFTPLYLIEQGDPDYKGKRASTQPAPEIEARTQQAPMFNPFGWLDEMKDD